MRMLRGESIKMFLVSFSISRPVPSRIKQERRKHEIALETAYLSAGLTPLPRMDVRSGACRLVANIRASPIWTVSSHDT